MNIDFRLTTKLLDEVLEDLRRPHPFAFERAGFFGCKVSATRGGLVVLAHTYLSLPDEWYIDDPNFGCVISGSAFRSAMQFALTNDASMFHVHLHDYQGDPWFSGPDLRESRKFVPDFWNVKSELPHGAIVLSTDRAAGLCWFPRRSKPVRIARLMGVGLPMRPLGGFL